MYREYGEAWILLRRAIDVSRLSVVRSATLEAEILLHLGKIERQLYYMGLVSAMQPASTLLDAIHIAYISEHDIGLMQQAYFEIAMVLVVIVGQYRFNLSSFQLEPIFGKPTASSSRRSSVTSISKGSKDKKDTKEKEKASEDKSKTTLAASSEHPSKKVSFL